MSANIHGKMIYSFQVPMWHNIAKPSTVPMTAEEVGEERFGGFFNIELRETSFDMNGEKVTDGYAIVRTASPYDQKEIRIGTCTKRYHPLQPREVARAFDINVNAPVETMGFLGKGEQMFLTWKLPNIKVMAESIQLYGTISTGFDTLNGTKLFSAIYRSVCANTLAMAEGWARKNTDGKGKGMIWSGKAVNENLLRDLGFWLSHVQAKAIHESNMLESLFGQLAEREIVHDSEAKDLLYKAFPDKDKVGDYYPSQLREEKDERIEASNKAQANIRDGIFALFAGEGTAITPNRWGLLNAGTEFFCHVLPSKKPIYESVMFGDRQAQSARLLKVLSE